jgi:hypothetical protein
MADLACWIGNDSGRAAQPFQRNSQHPLDGQRPPIGANVLVRQPTLRGESVARSLMDRRASSSEPGLDQILPDGVPVS